jgi:hypothetical protein
MSVSDNNSILVSEARLFHIDILFSGKYWFTIGAIGLTAGGHYTKDDIISLRNLCNKVLGE